MKEIAHLVLAIKADPGFAIVMVGILVVGLGALYRNGSSGLLQATDFRVVPLLGNPSHKDIQVKFQQEWAPKGWRLVGFGQNSFLVERQKGFLRRFFQ